MTTLRDLVSSFKEKDGIALSWNEYTKNEKGRVTHTEKAHKSYEDLFEGVNNYSKGLLELELEKGDRVALVSANVPQTAELLLAINNAGLVDVPHSEESTSEELQFFREHSGAKFVIVEDESVLERALEAGYDKNNIASIEAIKGVRNIKDILTAGESSTRKLEDVSESDMASIIYTSGTTGDPKGVMHTHGTLTSNVEDLLRDPDLSFDETDVALSGVLPMWHIYARTISQVSLDAGAEIFFTNKNKLHIKEDIPTQGITIVPSVPRIWETVYNGIMKNLKLEGEREETKKKLRMLGVKGDNPVLDLVERAINYKVHGKGGLGGWFYSTIADLLIFKKVKKKALGERFKFAVSGGGPLPAHIDNFFYTVGIEILEGYGMTEGPVYHVRRQGKGKTSRGTVGPPLANLEGQVRDETGKVLGPGQEGEYWVKAPYVTPGYYNNEEATKAVFDPKGWFNTQDVVILSSKGELSITDRTKDMFVGPGGENISPIKLENALKASPYIDTVITFGHKKPYNTALIVPDKEKLMEYCEEKGIPTDNLEAAFDHDEVQSLYQNEIKQIINRDNGFRTYELVRKFNLINGFDEATEFTKTLKPKRRVIEAMRSSQIEAMYGNVTTLQKTA